MYHNILFLNRSFYQYDEEIEKRLLDKGNKVFSYSIKPNATIINGTLSHISHELADRLAKKQQDKMIRDLSKMKIKVDIVFVLSGQQLAVDTLQSLKQLYPIAKFLWYIWDDVANIKSFARNKTFFDNIISFDKCDAEKYNLEFLPLFYTIAKKEQEKIYDLNFIGDAHSNRVELLSRILQKNIYVNPFIYLLAGKYTMIKHMLFKRKDIIFRYMKLKPLSYENVIDSFAKSKCIIDFPHPRQTGLTMRTFEAVGVHTKLITTNENVKQYDFYNPDNIYVLDKETLQMPNNTFFQKPYQDLQEEIFKKYSIDTWINTITDYFDGMAGWTGKRK